jgi:nucleotide-binding universal stress UspA family protein
MDMKAVLVHLDLSRHTDRRLKIAVKIAQDFGAHLTGLYALRPFMPPTLVAGDIVGVSEIQRQYRRAAEASAGGLEARFQKVIETTDLSYEWQIEEGAEKEVIALHARYADLTILGQPDPDEEAGLRSEPIAGEVALQAGRPVLVIPYAGNFENFGRRILVAWNASREAARALADAMPFLTRADEVIVLSIDPPGGDYIPGADIATYLARHDVKVDVRQTTAHDLEVGDSLLSRNADFGTDMIVMGAFGHARLTEIIFGGATRALLEHMTVPVFLSH